MSTATFETTDYGKIEVKRCNSDGSWSGVAYFFKFDWEVPVRPDGSFVDCNGTAFQVFWPLWRDSEASLEVTVPRMIGRAKVETGGASGVGGVMGTVPATVDAA
jgi:hypothetical protein